MVGDLVGVFLSSYILNEAAALGAPGSILLRMAFNVGVEGLVGMIPFAGDVFDAAFKANQRNLAVLALATATMAVFVSRWIWTSLAG